LLLLGGILAALVPTRPLFRPAAEIAALEWLNANAAPNSVVLSSIEVGNALPVYTDLRPFVGHGPETLFWEAKEDTAERFLRGELPAGERAALLHDFRVSYVLVEPPHRDQPPPPPSWDDGLTLVYDAGGYQIYAVNSSISFAPRSVRW
jgi:hypothetical protein